MNEKERTINLLKKNNLEPKKSFGQNFLIDEDIINKIISSLPIEKVDLIIEIGPGLGSLTKHFIERDKQVVAVDCDIDMVNVLNSLFASKDNIKIFQGDFLKFNIDDYCFSKNRLIVGNLPYNLTSKLIVYILENDFEYGGIMVQSEVLDKLLYETNKKENNALSAFFSLSTSVISIIDVSHEAFYPQPKIESKFIVFKRKLNISKNEFEVFKMLFIDPNKNISNCLKIAKRDDLIKRLDSELITKRARQFSLNDLHKLALMLL